MPTSSAGRDEADRRSRKRGENEAASSGELTDAISVVSRKLSKCEAVNVTLRNRIAELESEVESYAVLSNERLLAELPGRTASVLQSAMDAAVGLLADAKKEMSSIHAEARQRATTIVAKAESEALELIREASEEADATVRAARLRVASLVDDAMRDREEVVASLEGRRAELVREVGGLEARLRSLQEAHDLAERAIEGAIEAYRSASTRTALQPDESGGEGGGVEPAGFGRRGDPAKGGGSHRDAGASDAADRVTAVVRTSPVELGEEVAGPAPAPAAGANGAREATAVAETVEEAAGKRSVATGSVAKGSVAKTVPPATPGGRAVMRLLFVADGEGFRCALAVALMSRDIQTRRIAGVSVRYALEGELAPAPPKVISGLARRGLDIMAAQRVPLAKRVLESADLILAMTRQNVDALVAIAPSVAWRTFTVKSFVRRGQGVDERSSKESLDEFLARLDRRGDRPPTARPQDDDIAGRVSDKGYFDTVTEQLGLLSYEIGALLWPGQWNGQPRQSRRVGARAASHV